MTRRDSNRPHPADFSQSLWARTAEAPGAYPPLAGESSADVVVIGGGFTGLSAALHLAQRKISTIVVEAEEPGFGSSGRNAAGYSSLYLDQTPEGVVRTLGQERGDALNRMVAGASRLMLDIVDRYGIEADVRRTGVLVAAHEPQAVPELTALRVMWRQYGANIDLVGRDEAIALSGSPKVHGGLRFRDSGTINPLSYARGLAKAAVQEGAKLYAKTPATCLQAQPDGWKVTTAGGAVRAKHVLLATDAYPATATLWPVLEQTYYRIPIAVIASAPMGEAIKRFLPGGMPIADQNKTNHLWLMSDPDGRLVASLLPSVRDRIPAASVARKLETKLARMYGAIPQIGWEHYWLGMIAISAQRLPMALRLAPNLQSVGGYSGQGITTATAAGLEYAKFIEAGGVEAAAALPFADPAPVPLRRTLPTLLRNILGPLSWSTDRAYLKA